MLVTINGFPITTQFGVIDQLHTKPHLGIDLALPMQTPIASVGDGVVQAVTNEGAKSFGLSVKVHLNNGADVIYGHLAEAKVKAGQIVHQGDMIALSGSSGHSTGPHLHLQVMDHAQAVDPSAYLNAAVCKAQVVSPMLTDSMQLTTEIIRHAAESLLRGFGG